MNTTRKQYTKEDFKIGTIAKFSRENGVIAHTHTVKFGRPITDSERHLFQSVLIGFYYTVRFSHQFDGDFVAEPVIEFIDPQTARYTLRQMSMSGSWKDLLFAILVNFSYEIVPIAYHDESKAFAPRQEVVAAT